MTFLCLELLVAKRTKDDAQQTKYNPPLKNPNKHVRLCFSESWRANRGTRMLVRGVIPDIGMIHAIRIAKALGMPEAITGAA